MGLLQVRGFGKLALSSGRQYVLSFPSRRAEELLAYLLLTPGVTHSREGLIGRLWPGDDPENKRQNVGATLSEVRVVFEELGRSSPISSCVAASIQTIRSLDSVDGCAA
jgi:DNA-binding SARP family transcriptional activator